MELYIGVKEKKERDEEKKMEKKALALINENRMASLWSGSQVVLSFRSTGARTKSEPFSFN